MNSLLLELPLYTWCVLIVFLGASLVQLYFYLFVFRSVACDPGAITEAQIEQPKLPLSVVMYVRNEAENLKEHLPSILEQQYSKFEVIVVNDCSSDDTEDVLKSLQKQYDRLQVRNMVPATVSLHGRAVPLGVGIKAAQYDHIVLTDANCQPDSNLWLASLAAAFSGGTKVVMAYTRSEGQPFVRADRFFNAISELGFALKGKPYTNAGENVAFHKSLFFENKGFNSFLHKLNKVEKIFFNLVAQGNNTKVVLTPSSINCSSLSLTFGEWRRDKQQGLNSESRFRKGTHHKKLPELLARLILFISFPITIYLTVGVLWAWAGVVGMFLCRWLVQINVFYKAQKRLSEKNLLLSSLFWDWCAVPAYLSVLLSIRPRR